MSRLSLWARPATRNIHPLGQTRPFLAFDIDNVSVASAATANAIFLGLIPVLPVLILFDAFLLVEGRRLQVWLTRQLSCRSIRRAVLYGSVPVAEVSEVVDVAGSQ